MSRIVYVNGAFVAEEEAVVSIFDRGFLFADAVYEVAAVLEGKLVDNAAHLARLTRSLGELQMASPAGDHEITAIQKELVERNALREGLVYLQITRGTADREFHYPANTVPTLVMFTQKKNLLHAPLAATGIAVITTADIRWQRRDIKTINLLPACMAKQAAVEAGANDAWMHEDGLVTEGSSNNAYIISHDGTIVTRALSNRILHGITRRAVLKLAEEMKFKVEERAFTLQEAYEAAEAFVTSASTFVMPVTKIDNHFISNGAPGPVTLRLREMYIAMARAEAV